MRCPIEGCETTVSVAHLMCAKHWRMVPRLFQGRVYRAWRELGIAQRAGNVSACRAAGDAHQVASKAAIDAVEKKERSGPARRRAKS